jgi:chromosome segregation ATPase
VILGPIVGLRKPEYAPEPAPGETSREIFQARRGIQEANEGMKDLRESQEKLTSSVESIAKNTAEAQRKLTAVLAVLNQRVKRLEGDNSTAGDEQPQAKTTGPGEEDVVVRSPNP